MNKTERSFEGLMRSHGYNVYRNGWPDYMVVSPDGKEAFAVEVKYGDDPLDEGQERMTKILAQYGVKVFVVRAPHVSGKRRTSAGLGWSQDAADSR